MRLDQLDPDWAWEPCERSEWTIRDVAHLYRRVGFGASPETLQQGVEESRKEVVRKLVYERSESTEYLKELDALAFSVLATDDVNNLPAWWAYRLLTSPDQLQEKITLFWHGHFATGADKVNDAQLMYQQNNLLRKHALGDFGQLLHEVSRDPAMMIYLDSASNRKAHPNENYAREIMELFCLGEGNYSENDIRDLARCFTGWEIRRGKFRVNRYQHDSGQKTVLGETGKYDGEDGVSFVLKQKAGPEFIVKKLIRFFLLDEPEPPIHLLAPLAQQFRDNGWQIAPVIERMLSSNLFFSEYVIGRKVRSPVDFSVGLLRSLNGSTDMYSLANGMSDLGQRLFFPPNVKGWDGGRSWINSSTMVARANYLNALLKRKQTRFDHGTLSDLIDQHNLRTSTDIVTWWEDLLLAIKLPQTVRDNVASVIDQKIGQREDRIRTALHLLCTLPEYQLS